jgi:ATPase inhibitor, mitochondrial
MLIRPQEQEQLAALRAKQQQTSSATTTQPARDDIEGGFGGQEDLEDRYATTSGEH